MNSSSTLLDVRADEPYFVEIIPSQATIRSHETILFDYWLYLSQSGNFEGLENDLYVENEIVNVFYRHDSGDIVNSEDLYIGARIFYDPESNSLIAKESYHNSPSSDLLKRGDILIAIDDKPVQDLQTMYVVLKDLTSDKQVKYSIIRDSEPKEIIIHPRKYSDEVRVYNQNSTTTFQVFTENDPSASQVIARSGPGLKEGDVIKKVNGVEIGTHEDWVRIARSALMDQEYLFTILRGSKEIVVPIRPIEKNVSIMVENVYMEKMEDLKRQAVMVHGKRYVKIRAHQVRVRFDSPGEFVVNPGKVRVRPDFAKPGQAKALSEKSISIPTPKAKITVI